MGKKKILFVSQEITPYLPDTYMSNVGLNLPKNSIELGNETRVFLPKFGVIKEKTNNLHEVIRLSGMNLILDDFDHQLIIKVALYNLQECKYILLIMMNIFLEE